MKMKARGTQLGFVLSVVVVTMFIASSASANTILIDVGAGTLATSPDAQGRYWNAWTGTTAGSSYYNFVDTANTATTVDLKITTSFTGTNTAGTNASVITNYQGNATYDGIHTGVASAFRFEGLDTNLTYNLTLYGSRADGTERIADATIGGVTQSFNIGNGTPGEGMTTFANLSPNANGWIEVTYAPQGNAVYLGVVALETAVPEPATMSLLGIGAILLRLRRRNN